MDTLQQINIAMELQPSALDKTLLRYARELQGPLVPQQWFWHWHTPSTNISLLQERNTTDSRSVWDLPGRAAVPPFLSQSKPLHLLNITCQILVYFSSLSSYFELQLCPPMDLWPSSSLLPPAGWFPFYYQNHWYKHWSEGGPGQCPAKTLPFTLNNCVID